MKAEYITPAVTAFDGSGHVAVEDNKKIYDHLMKHGIKGVLLLGSIGEFYGITPEEKRLLIREAISYINHRMKIYVGTGSLCFEECVSLSNDALEQGADAVAIISPYYFRLSDDEVYEFYARLAARVKGDILLYNFPDRTGYQMSVEVTLRLATDFPNIIGIKDTVSTMDHTRQLIQAIKAVRPGFLIYSGFDEFFFHNVLSGGDGCIAGLSNVIPKLASSMVKAAESDSVEDMKQYQRELDALMQLYGISHQFVPVIKKAAQLMGVEIDASCCVPMGEVSECDEEKIRKLLRKLGYIKGE